MIPELEILEVKECMKKLEDRQLLDLHEMKYVISPIDERGRSLVCDSMANAEGASLAMRGTQRFDQLRLTAPARISRETMKCHQRFGMSDNKSTPHLGMFARAGHDLMATPGVLLVYCNIMVKVMASYPFCPQSRKYLHRLLLGIAQAVASMSAISPIPTTVANTIKICNYINSLGFSPKEFMVTFLSADNPDLNSRRRLMKVGLGAKQTRSIVKNLGRLTNTSDQGKGTWEELVFEEASIIVNAQEVPRGHFPAGAYVSSSRITPDFFGESAEKIRNEQVRTGMRFLYRLIHSKIAAALKQTVIEPDDHDEVLDLPPSSADSTPTETLEIEGALDDTTVLSLENMVYVKSTPADNAAHKLATVPVMVCSMIAGVCNRRSNAIAMANGLVAFAGGVSCRVKCSEEADGLAAFLVAMGEADRKPVNMSLFSPGPAEAAHWKFVIKAQLAKALIEYSTHIEAAPDRHKLAPCATRPPAVDPIPMHQPNIHFLRMMDAPDSSAEGVTRVLDQIKAQIAVDDDTYAEKLLVAGGDVGSNLLVESLRVKRFPPINHIEGFEWVLSVFGGAHTTWNVAKAIWGMHWGNSDDKDNTGVWRSSFALGGDCKKPPASQDFNSIMRSLQQVHKANMVFILKSADHRSEIWNRPNLKGGVRGPF
ncbi:uncharacterized protein MELLADRAFT_101645 [Melampsora larici-populina 98AG31]|uniref:DUF6589 domain-containing protein n=1 Tax=Melampsora larici-populina (strain 98AG31 / pathotype 3-4-7) TaxID=747676 RepID=F4R6I2_MELLP|nr:uncharacterized protein MELLADRAFT_101645 [Melampsora larici-populina 98AG31]EGG12459.1 hypothetical protein MELLADRAFT_101645 [Melampsora larici-populina 98AG31]